MATEATTQATTPTTEQTKVTFTPEQQTRIDEIVRDAMGRAGSEAREAARTAAEKQTTLESELTTLKQSLARTTDKADKKQQDEAAAAQVAEMKSINENTLREVERLKQVAAAKEREVVDAKHEALTVKKTVAIQSAASAHGFVDVDVVTALTSNAIHYDDQKGRWVVNGENGQPRLNSAYEPMSLDEYFAEFASKKPYLVRGDVKTGIGSSETQRSGLSNNGKYAVEQIFGKKSDAGLANQLALKDPKEYQRLKHIAREGKLI